MPPRPQKQHRETTETLTPHRDFPPPTVSVDALETAVSDCHTCSRKATRLSLVVKSEQP
jgi:hypothetical protein